MKNLNAKIARLESTTKTMSARKNDSSRRGQEMYVTSSKESELLISEISKEKMNEIQLRKFTIASNHYSFWA